jgi:hypothetical protein
VTETPRDDGSVDPSGPGTESSAEQSSLSPEDITTVEEGGAAGKPGEGRTEMRRHSTDEMDWHGEGPRGED